MSIFKSKVHKIEGGNATIQQIGETITVIHLFQGTEVQFSTGILRRFEEERWAFDSQQRMARIAGMGR
jgi:hypothetical protein